MTGRQHPDSLNTPFDRSEVPPTRQRLWTDTVSGQTNGLAETCSALRRPPPPRPRASIDGRNAFWQLLAEL
eukprot:3735259-Prymnesium_polylepis.1